MALNPIPQNPSSADSAAATLRSALALKQFGGEVIAEFKEQFKTRALHRVKTVAAGAKAALFPALGGLSTKYHRAGDNILVDSSWLQTIAQGDKSIFLDRERLTAVVVDKVEEMIAYWDARQEYTKEMAHALAVEADKNVIRVLCRAARRRQAQSYTAAPQGEFYDVTGDGGADETASEIVDGFAYARRVLMEKNIPQDGAFYGLITPATMEKLINSTAGREAINADFNPPNGSIKEGFVGMLHGFQLIETNNFPTDDYDGVDHKIDGSTAGSEGNEYQEDLSGTNAPVALAFWGGAVASAIGSEISLETERKIELRGDLLVAGYQMGHGELRPEGVVELNNIAAAPTLAF